MGGYEQIGMLIHSDHSCGETESYIEYYSQAVFDQFNDNSCIALNGIYNVIVVFSQDCLEISKLIARNFSFFICISNRT